MIRKQSDQPQSEAGVASGPQIRDSKRSLGWPLPADDRERETERARLRGYLTIKLAAQGHEVPGEEGIDRFLDVAHDLLANHRERSRLLADHLCPVDRRIQDFLDAHLGDVAGELEDGLPRLPGETFVCDRHGLARELSLPRTGSRYESRILESYRVANGVLHNPAKDRRTTKGVFHVAEGGLPIPTDKKAVPKATFARLVHAAMRPPGWLTEIPYTVGEDRPVHGFCSLMLRPLVCPEVPGTSAAKRLEVRFFAPGSLVANLDFVESVFGNAGDPSLPENDAALDPEGWTGHTGCVILAPHLIGLTKKELGLPRTADATERQRRDGMCWEDEGEKYNDGGAFKITCRTADGVMVTLIADNYFGYSKKEVKTQIGYSANLFGLAEEEHAGGALAFPTFSLGDEFIPDSRVTDGSYTFAEAVERLGDRIEVRDDGYAVDRAYRDVIYVPEDARISLRDRRVTWTRDGGERSIPLRKGEIYVHPSGYKVRLAKHPGAPSWRLIGTHPEGTLCHKPCTVSGGGKSEISKSLGDAVIYGPLYVHDVERDLDRVAEVIERDYGDRRKPELRSGNPSRPLLSEQRSLGSVIKMLTPSEEEFTPEYNAWLESVPDYIRALVFIIKRLYKPEWGADWRSHFGVDIVNGDHGHEFKFEGRKIVASYLRVGQLGEERWRTFKLRQDFIAADKIQFEDDITASVVMPAEALPNLDPGYRNPSVKLVVNCEHRLFQRPDDAIIRGFDSQAEADIAGGDNFLSNYQPLSRDEAREIVDDAVDFAAYTEPMRRRLRRAAEGRTGDWVVSSAHPRIVDGKPTKNPRYLQVRPDMVDPRARHVAEMGVRLHRRIPDAGPVIFPVNAVLPGRRNNPAQEGIRPLAVYNPIHYQELPELFMDFICSLTGKSPSTTGAGSEGALTKGPFNALLPTADLNNALVSYIVCGYDGFSTAAGWIGHRYQVQHDISLLMPELWCRLRPEERDPGFLIEHGYLERLEDFDHAGERVLASRLGYRINQKFVHHFLGRVFDSPDVVFDEGILQPESQNVEHFVDGIGNILEAHQRVARAYFEDGSIDQACPPLKALLHIMAEGSWNGRGADDPEVRGMFTREYLLASDWYQERLLEKQQREIALWRRHVAYLEDFLARDSHRAIADRFGLEERLENARRHLHQVREFSYLQGLRGTIGADPLRAISG